MEIAGVWIIEIAEFDALKRAASTPEVVPNLAV